MFNFFNPLEQFEIVPFIKLKFLAPFFFCASHEDCQVVWQYPPAGMLAFHHALMLVVVWSVITLIWLVLVVLKSFNKIKKKYKISIYSCLEAILISMILAGISGIFVFTLLEFSECSGKGAANPFPIPEEPVPEIMMGGEGDPSNYTSIIEGGARLKNSITAHNLRVPSYRPDDVFTIWLSKKTDRVVAYTLPEDYIAKADPEELVDFKSRINHQYYLFNAGLIVRARVATITGTVVPPLTAGPFVNKAFTKRDEDSLVAPIYDDAIEFD